MERLKVAGVTEVLVEAGLPSRLLPDRSDRSRAAILTQPAARPRAVEISDRLVATGIATEVIGLPDRDEAKTLAVAESVYESLARFGLSRHDTVIGVGGGAVTDLAGYVAGTWLRGVEVVHFPTTLLAAVDASIGGKTGVNLAGKNLVGVFWHPTRVVVDTELLEALPTWLLREGFSEAYKAGLIGDRALCDLVTARGLGAPLQEVVTRAATVKVNIVNEDEREHGKRAYLNLGHTIGHAIEFASSLSHGASVAVGMVAAVRISSEVLGFSESETVISTLGLLGLPVDATDMDSARVRDLLRHDKKRDEVGLRMVLLESIEAPVVRHVTGDEIEIGLAAVGL
ncbi:MAG: 3-dehydroquinate synthase family protein [Actinomycetota bacterium]|nr:3-dehydroquinate synthase family protein [Actinomycetota bacterium]